MNIETVINFLREHAGYSPAPQSLNLVGIDFQFDGILVGPERHDGLVLLENVHENNLNTVTKKLRALMMALERTDSMRTVILILFGGSPNASVCTELNKLCRVLVVQQQTALESSLASILPLLLPEPISSSGTADATLKSELDAEYSNPFVTKLIKAARANENEVQQMVRDAVDEIAQVSKTP